MDLVVIQNRQAVTTSLQVAESFEKRHDNVLREIEGLLKIEEAQKYFQAGAYEHPQNKQQYRMYYMNRDGFTLLAMGFNGKKALEFKLKYIQAFNKMEQALIEQPQPNYHLPSTFKEALIMLAESVDENDKLKQQIENDREKVVLANAITTSDEGLLIEAAAKYMRQNGVNIGRDRLFKWLRGQGYLVSRQGREYNMPTQKSLNQGLMKIHTQQYFDSEGELKVNRQVVVTGKGLMFFINKFLHDGQLTLRLD
ncbi:phage regulatory protein/antirepressor Ant [Lysinibacillus sp. A4]|uniref:phage regulatory protein/antirepressor Ant n=1 Tax=Lysinibacillus sp. A4 TaxID=2976269 RepID=UPI0021761B97|nr:phage regulatory protein/antirepressor Ant [Lysinibacillus sp. A4]MCS5499843.1 phage regulatory protein/antirepressor Ant [Lysinibacillus sp. A4]